MDQIETPDYTKYTTALALMDAVIAVVPDPDLPYEQREAARDAASDIVNIKWDELYTYVYDHFKQPDTHGEGSSRFHSDDDYDTHPEILSMREMFKLNRTDLEARLREIPPTILEQCFPVWIARHLLRDYHAPIQPKKTLTFSKFHADYGFMVIYSTSNR